MGVVKIFSLELYRQYLIDHKSMIPEQADLLIKLNKYNEYDGKPLNDLLAQGHLLLDIWCVDHKQ